MVSIANTLAGALHTNVFAINQIQSEIDSVQGRLSSGRRVNSPLDNPNSFFLATSLRSQATQLNILLDGISSKVSTVRQANEAVSTLTDLVGQLKTTAQSAQQVLTDNPSNAQITGSRNLSAVTDLPSLAGIDNSDQLVFSYVDTDDSITSSTVTISNNDSTSDLIDNINAITDSGANQVFEASLNSSGQLTIKTQDATRFEIDFQTSGGAADTQLVAALGFGGYVTNEVNNGTSETRITVSPTPSLTTVPLFDRSAGTTAASTTTLLNLSDTSGGPSGDIFNGDSNDALKISIDGGTASTVVSDISTATVQDLIDGINENGTLRSKLSATFDATTGELNIRAIDNSVESVQFELVEDSSASGTAGKIDLQQLGIGAQVLQGAADGNGLTSSESILLGPGVGDLADLESEFNDIRTQIDELVGDSEFDNVNLLEGDDLTVTFNALGTSSLTVEGRSLTVSSLGVSAANFGNSDNISAALTEVNNALDTVESFSNGLENDLNIIQARQSYTDSTISNLNEGADNLTLADLDEDGALLLVLQERKRLSITVLGLSSESQSSVLRAV